MGSIGSKANRGKDLRSASQERLLHRLTADGTRFLVMCFTLPLAMCSLRFPFCAADITSSRLAAGSYLSFL